MNTFTRSVSGSLMSACTILSACLFSLSTAACGGAVPAARTATPMPAQPTASQLACTGADVTSDEELAALAGCTLILGDLRIRETSVTSLTTLTSLRAVRGELDISRNWHLRSLSGLESLREVGRLNLRSNPRLASLRALAGLRAAAAVVLEDTPLLRDCSGLEGLTSVETLTINETGLRRLDGLDNLVRVRHLALLGNPDLISAGALRRVENAENIEIRGNRLLYAGQDEFLPGLTSAFQVVIAQNAAISASDVLAFRRRLAIAPEPSGAERASR